MRKRDPKHYLNVNTRCSSMIQSYKVGEQVVCLNMQFFGVVGKVAGLNRLDKLVKVEFDKREEESKIHDPFMGRKCLEA